MKINYITYDMRLLSVVKAIFVIYMTTQIVNALINNSIILMLFTAYTLYDTIGESKFLAAIMITTNIINIALLFIYGLDQ